MMKTLLKKELREHRWVFAAALAVISLGYLRSMYALLPAQAWLHITRRSFLMVTSIGGGGFMLALGFRQMFEEKRRGSWTFLLHRPITRQRIFAAKVLAAIVMFAGAAVLPTALLAAWCAWPGNIAGPFVPSMLVPAGVDLLCALPYYFTGCLIGLWQARFTASRGLLLVVPLWNSLFAHGAAEAWMPLLSTVVAICWMGWLARAAFMGFERRRRSGWAMLAAALWVGLGGVHMVGVAFMPEPITESYMRGEQNVANDRWFVSQEGDMKRAIIRHGSVEAVFAEDGQPLEGEYEGMGVWLHDIEAEQVEMSPSLPSSFYGRRYREERRFERIARIEDGYTREWYYDHRHRRYVAFDRRAGGRIGSLGPDGFSPRNEGRGFDGKPLVRLGVAEPVLFFEGGVFQVNWRDVSIVRVKMKGEGRWSRASQLGLATRRLLRSSTHVVVIEGKRPTAAIALDEKLASDSISVGYVEATEEYFVRYPRKIVVGQGEVLAPPNDRETIVFYAKEGGETRRWLSPKAPKNVSRAMQVSHRSSTLRQALVVPPALNGFEMMKEEKQIWNRVNWRPLHVAVVFLVGLLSALFSLLLSRGHTLSLRLTIAGLCLLGGPTGVVLPWLFPKERGAACSECGARRKVNDQPCDACGEQLRGYATSDSDIIDDIYLPA